MTSMKGRLKQWAANTTMHGWSHLLNEAKSLPAKIFWWVVLLVFSALLIVLIASTLEVYLKGQSWQANIYMEPFDGEPVKFPPFKICPTNRISKRSAENMGLTDPDMITLYLMSFEFKSTFPTMAVAYNESAVKRFSQWRQGTGLNSSEITRRLTPSCKETLLYMQIGYESDNKFDESKDGVPMHVCDTAENQVVKVKSVPDMKYGICYLIELKGNDAYRTKTGSNEAITFFFLADPSDVIPHVTNNQYITGLDLLITDDSKEALPITAGQRVRLGLSPTNTNYEAAQFSFKKPPCVNERPKILYELNQLNALPNLPLSSWPSESSLLERRLMQLDIYFEVLDTRVFTIYQSGGFDGFLSDVGGQLGLWAGVSLMTIVHFFGVVVFPTICFCFGKKADDDDEETVSNMK